jgi:hypothetical protein
MQRAGKRDAISQNDLNSRLANNAATKKLIVLDTCNSGRLGDALQWPCSRVA